jgi:hypothetical protein
VNHRLFRVVDYRKLLSSQIHGALWRSGGDLKLIARLPKFCIWWRLPSLSQ